MNKELPTETITMDNVEKIYDFIFAPYVKQLKLSFLEIGVGRVVARLDNSKDYQFVTGALSGQVLMSVIDTTMSIAMNTSLKSQRGTLSQNNNFIRPAFGDYFIIESVVQRFGSTIAIGETKVFSENNKDDILCHATSTFPLK
ncbi:MAG: PaaI family thioesterase [Candidatus Puniceispirillales bacterium]|jgi:acyl-coenzyme A thioesterase PaaI-like protein